MGKILEDLMTAEPSTVELVTLALEFGKEAKWVDEKLRYVARRALYEWLMPSQEREIRESSIRRAGHIRLFERTVERKFRYNKALEFHGACWLKLDDISKNMKGEELDILVLLEGSSGVGWLIPPKIVPSARRGEVGEPRATEPVMFDLVKRKRDGGSMHILFEGDESDATESPIKSMCSLFGPAIKDVRRSLNSLVLATLEEPWERLRYEDNKFCLGFTVNPRTKERLLTSGLSLVLDTVVKSVEAV